MLILHYTHLICLNNKRNHGGISPALLSDGREQDEEEDGGAGRGGGVVSVDLSCQIFWPIATRICAI